LKETKLLSAIYVDEMALLLYSKGS